jgi:HAD superfamily hydrolase (TIGR01509 family)
MTPSSALSLTCLKIKGIVFDLDATLIDLGEHVRWREAQGEIIEAYRTCGCSEEMIASCTSKGLFNLMHEMETRLTATKSREEIDELREKIWKLLDSYEDEGVQMCGFMPGTRETLEWLKAQGIKMAVCTSNSGDVAKQILEKLEVSQFFQSVIGRTPGLLMKPHTDQVLACFKEIGVDPRDGVMVGDSHNDVLAGKAAGARAIAVPVYFTNKSAMEAARPDATVKSMKELPEALLGFR